MDNTAVAKDISEPINSKNSKIHRRIGHVAVKYKNFIVVWGGYEDEKHNDLEQFSVAHYHQSDEVLLFDMEYEIWHSVLTEGEVPPTLCGCTAAISGDSMFVFGGFCEEPVQESSNVRTLYELNMRTMRWGQVLAAGLPPLACDKLVSWCYKGAFYVFGGFGPYPDHVSDYPGLRLSAHPGEERCWNSQLVRFRRSSAGRRWDWPAAGGDPPSPRAAHAAARVGSRLFVFGGRMGRRRMNDLHCLELDAMQWTRLEPADQSAPVPQGRSWHSLTPLRSDQLLLYGGFNGDDEPLADPWVWDIAGRRWSQCPWLGSPPVRMWHAAAPGDTADVLLVGGLESSIFTNHSQYASQMVVVRRTPKTLLRVCMDVLERHRDALSPDVWLLPESMVDQVMARLTAAGSRLLA